ncbi:MAG: adenylate/guanylate cyclase domain-containing protein [Bacteroidota bacterium]
MLSHKSRRILLQIVPFGVIPSVFSIIYTLLVKGILGDYPVYPSTGNPYGSQFLVPAILSAFVGLSMGTIEISYLNKSFQNRSFTQKLIVKSVIYLTALVTASLIITVLTRAFEEGISPFDTTLISDTVDFFTTLAFWSIVTYFGMAVLICLFILEVSDNIGQAVLHNFLTGKYHHPIEEERVYMFLDMKSSTTHAEQLGHVRYFEMLKEYYVDLSEPIVRFGGEIYQYVGDEVIVTWKLKGDFAQNALDCFFAMKLALGNQSKKYEAKYGVIPTFKAGLHHGKVTTGEIGVIKREITFSGDVLNTTARIQGLCNHYQVDLLVSEKFVQALPSTGTYRPIPLGEAELRGRHKMMNLFTVEKVVAIEA